MLKNFHANSDFIFLVTFLIHCCQIQEFSSLQCYIEKWDVVVSREFFFLLTVSEGDKIHIQSSASQKGGLGTAYIHYVVIGPELEEGSTRHPSRILSALGLWFLLKFAFD